MIASPHKCLSGWFFLLKGLSLPLALFLGLSFVFIGLFLLVAALLSLFALLGAA